MVWPIELAVSRAVCMGLRRCCTRSARARGQTGSSAAGCSVISALCAAKCETLLAMAAARALVAASRRVDCVSRARARSLVCLQLPEAACLS